MEAYDTNDVLLARKSETVKVTAGNTAECSIALKLFASSILDSGYILWKYSYTDYTNYFEGFSSISENTDVTSTSISDNSLSFAEDTDGNKYVMTLNYSDSHYYIKSTSNITSEISTDDINLFPFQDSLYYDDSAAVLWAGLYSYDEKEDTNTICFSKIKELDSNGITPKYSDFSIHFESGDFCSFAIQGSVLYLSYKQKDKQKEIYYLQRATITENADGTFAVSKVGSAKSVSDLGVSGAITDVAILYDGTVYVLVSNVGNSSGDSKDSFMYNSYQNNIMYSRGALLKIQSTSSGFEVVDTLGWTGSSRQIAPVGIELESSLTAYIPPLSEKSNKFYGPRRFVAIKPKEIAIADCGANFVMPKNTTDGIKTNGKMFDHNRVVTVSLSSFAINVVTELRNIKFSDLTFSGSGISGGYINAIGCEYENNDKIEEQ